MKTIWTGLQNLAYVIRLNSDRILYVLTVAVALFTGGYIGALFWSH